MTRITEPTNCPCCDSILEKVVDQLFCRNISCSAQVSKKLEHFTKTLSIKGLGPKTIEKLNLQSLTELYYLDSVEVCELLGNTIGQKVLKEIEKSKSSSLATVLASFSIPLIGETASKAVASVASNIDEIDEDLCKKAGLGAKATANLLTWLNTEYLEYKDYLPFKYDNTIEINTDGMKKVCITGKLTGFKSKADAESALLDSGYILVDNLTKDVDILIDEKGSTSSKREKALKYNIPIINDITQILRKN